ncbi:MAG: phenylalanine--tRNA ligase subunit alpha [Candidatus Paceibacterota bacterium]
MAEENTTNQIGHHHPITRMNRQINSIFFDLGFEVVDGPEIEDEWHNFDALNIPEHHPARDMWDTFWLKGENPRTLLRTHTSPIQIRYMEEYGAPVRIIAPGKVFRNEATDATHEAQFYQVEGLLIAQNITLAHLKTTLTTFFQELFHADISARLRPSYFPFVEPGVEMDISCFLCESKGCRVCKQTGWIEVLGAGMVHPNVLSNVGLDPEKWQGFAFGGGTDRFAMLKYGIDDIRKLYTGDLRVVNQF